MEPFDTLESEVRGYIRGFPTVFTKGKGSHLWDENGKKYIDFFAGAGALNYGHNPEPMKEKVLEYMSGDGIVHGLDLGTTAKRTFLERFHKVILEPRGLDYKMQFPGPTGTNSTEAALKLARKVTGRPNVVAFTNGFHGMTLGSLAATGNSGKRAGGGVKLGNVSHMPYDGYLGDGVDTLTYFERALEDKGSGLDKPAAVILETVQAEGGVRVASIPWLQRLRALTEKHGILMIVDDIQVGCGRTGPFFSFEHADIKPDIVCLSKALSGYGLPFAMVLLKPEHDIWGPSEHNGTFRGNNLAFVTGAAVLDRWEDDSVRKETEEKGHIIRERLVHIAHRFPALEAKVRGRGLIQGIECKKGIAKAVSKAAFDRGLVIETAGHEDEVLKFLTPLNIERDVLAEGLGIIEESFEAVAGQMKPDTKSDSSELQA
jgi:diaminobutyrate-2-oxoglutarate transaminase